jgi:hypothetical protein
LSRNGRCSAFASSHGARIHTSHAFCICENHGHCPGMDRFNDRVGFRGQEAVDQVRTGDWLGLDAAVALVLGPEPAEGEQRSVLIERKPTTSFFLVSGLVVRPICAKPGTFGGFFLLRVSWSRSISPSLIAARGCCHPSGRWRAICCCRAVLC